MTFTSFSRSGSASADEPKPAFAPLASQPMSERQAQYAAWKERLMQRTRDDEVIDLVDDTPSPWSPESLFRD